MNDNLEEFDSDTLVPVSQFSRLSWNSSIVSNQAIVTPEGTTTTREKKIETSSKHWIRIWSQHLDKTATISEHPDNNEEENPDADATATTDVIEHIKLIFGTEGRDGIIDQRKDQDDDGYHHTGAKTHNYHNARLPAQLNMGNQLARIPCQQTKSGFLWLIEVEDWHKKKLGSPQGIKTVSWQLFWHSQCGIMTRLIS